MGKPIVVIGFGAAGRATVRRLLARGEAVRVAQRKRPPDLPAQADFIACDVLKAHDVREAVVGAGQVVLAVGFPYDARIWRTHWPATITNVIDACAAEKVRVVFVDNLYQLGPQRKPRTEDMPLTTRGAKPAILTKVTRIWMAAAKTGKVKIAALRCTDFYGPGVPVSHLGASAFGQLARGKRAQMLAPLDTPHDFAYVPDIARAVLTLLDAPDDAFGQVWNMPCAPTRTPREILTIGAKALGVKLKITALPPWSLPILGLFSRFLKEVADVDFTMDRPYIVDPRKFTSRFGFDVTPFEIGAAETAQSFAR
jgi:nucleoside-diphosphate-sugar epimerase